MSEPVNQHYLPQFYLRGFTDLKTGQLQVFQNGDSHWKKRGVKSVASAPYLHSYRNEKGEHRHEIENMFAKLEGMFNSVVSKALNQETLTNDDQLVFACFIMFMWRKVPSEVDHFNAFCSEFYTRVLELHHQEYTRNPDALKRWKEQYRLETGEDKFANLRAEDLNPAKTKITFDWHAALMMLIKSAIQNSEVLYKMGWTFYQSSISDYFITSDHPFSIFDPTNADRNYEAGFAYANVEICFPLSRHVAFSAGWKSKGRQWLSTNKRVVEEINTRTAAFATREIIATNRAFPGYNKRLTPFYKW